MILFLWKRYLFSSTKNQRNSQKVLLDLDKRYNKITKNRVNNTISGKNSNYNINSKNFSPSKQRINTHLQKKIQNLDNSIRKKKYFKETLDSIPFYDEKEIQKRIFHSQSGERLFSLYNGHKFTFSIKNIITTFMKYAELTKLSPVNKISLNDKRFISLLYKAEEIIPQANNLERVLLCWALTKLEINESILENLTKILSDSINLLSFKHLSIFSWCLAKNKIRNARTFGMLSLRVCEILNSDNNITVEIPEIKSSEGKNENLDDNSEDLKSDLELEMNDDKDGFENSCQKIEIKSITPHSLTLILWAFGKSKMRDDDLFELASDIIIKNFEKFSAKMLNIILYSYKSLKIKSKIIYLISDKIIKDELILSNESILTLKTYLVSLAKLKPMKDLSPILIKIALLILEKHSTKSKNLSPKFMSEILWNLSTNKCYDKFVLKKMEKMVISNIHLLNDIDLTQCFYSYCIFTQIGNKKEFKNVLDLLAERMNIYQKKFNKKSLKLIEEGKKISELKNKNLNFI